MDRLFNEGQHQGHEAHVRLYEALDASIQQDLTDQHNKDIEKERKRKRKHQSNHAPPPDSPPHPPPLPPP